MKKQFTSDGRRLRQAVSRALALTQLLLIANLHSAHSQNDLFDETAHLWPSEVQDSSLQFGGDVPSTRLTSLDVICSKHDMTVRAEFNAPFKGIIFSKGTYGQSKCVYVKPHSGLTHLTFNVRYDECGTKPDLQGKYFENTIVIQYGTDIIEALDEAKRLRCEWFEAYEKPATFRPAIPVADLDIIEMNFQGDEIDCWMSIQEGKGPWSNEINRIVTVGQPLSLVVAINDHKNQFDMKVKSCFAHDGVKSPIYLIDEDGCVLRPGMFSQFQKFRNPKGSGKASLISYAQFLAFKFPDSVDVQIQCTVEVCRHGCSNTCDSADRSQVPSKQRNPTNLGPIDSNHYQSRPTSGSNHEMNRFLMENADLLESASSNEAVTVEAPVYIDSSRQSGDGGTNQYGEDQAAHNSTKQQLNIEKNIAAFVQNVEQKQPSAGGSGGHAEFNVASKVSLGNRPTPHGNGRPAEPSIRTQVPPNSPRPFFALPPHRPRPMAPVQHHQQDPVAQVMNIPLSPMYMSGARQPQPRPLAPPNLMANPFNSLRLLKSKSPLLPQLLSGYFGKTRRSQYVPNDNFEFISKLSPGSVAGQRVFRTRRFVRDTQGEVGLKRGFQVVTSLDLSFSPNMSADQMPEVFEGIPAPIVYGVCFSTTHFFYFVALSLIFLLSGVASCVYIIFRLERAKKNPH